MQVRLRVIVVFTYKDTSYFFFFVSKSVMSLNEPSFVSARPKPQPCDSSYGAANSRTVLEHSKHRQMPMQRSAMQKVVPVVVLRPPTTKQTFDQP